MQGLHGKEVQQSMQEPKQHAEGHLTHCDLGLPWL